MIQQRDSPQKTVSQGPSPQKACTSREKPPFQQKRKSKKLPSWGESLHKIKKKKGHVEEEAISSITIPLKDLGKANLPTSKTKMEKWLDPKPSKTTEKAPVEPMDTSLPGTKRRHRDGRDEISTKFSKKLISHPLFSQKTTTNAPEHIPEHTENIHNQSLQKSIELLHTASSFSPSQVFSIWERIKRTKRKTQCCNRKIFFVLFYTNNLPT